MAEKKKSIFDGRKTWFAFAAISALATAFVIANLLSAVSSEESYWVISEDLETQVEARTKITPEMLTRVNVPASAMPANAINIRDIQAAVDTADESDDYYSVYRLQPGDIITTSNTGQLTTLSSEVEDGEAKVAASFKVNPSLAAGGNIKAGDRIDVAVVYENTAVFFLTNVPVVSATIDLDGREATEEGTPVLYVVAVSPKDAASIAIASQYSIYVVLSSPNGEPNKAGATLSEILGGLGSTDMLDFETPVDGPSDSFLEIPEEFLDGSDLPADGLATEEPVAEDIIAVE
jgi:Flp pilus assembly protein CpaB